MHHTKALEACKPMQRNSFSGHNLKAALPQLRSVCKQCKENAPSQQAESMILLDLPESPFQQAVTDFSDIEGHNFIIYADRFSEWLEVARL